MEGNREYIPQRYLFKLVKITNGIPQGSVLGPTLFLIPVKDMPEGFESYTIRLLDDDKLMRKINVFWTATTSKKIRLQHWSDTWL